MLQALAVLLARAEGPVTVPEGTVVLHPYADEAQVKGWGAGGAVPDAGVTLELMVYELPTRTLSASGEAGSEQCPLWLTVSVSPKGSVHAVADFSCGNGLIESAAIEALKGWKFRVVSGNQYGKYAIPVNVRFRANEATADVDILRAVRAGEPGQLPPGLHFADAIRLKYRAKPEYPSGAGGQDVTCRVQFDIDEGGTPTAIAVDGCPDAFAERAEAAAWKWRFYPYVVDGVPQRAVFYLDLKFVVR